MVFALLSTYLCGAMVLGFWATQVTRSDDVTTLSRYESSFLGKFFFLRPAGVLLALQVDEHHVVTRREILVEAGRRLRREGHGRGAGAHLQVGRELAAEGLGHHAEAALRLEIDAAALGRRERPEVDLVEVRRRRVGTVLQVELDALVPVEDHLGREDAPGDGLHGGGGRGEGLRAVLEVDQQTGGDGAAGRDLIDGVGVAGVAGGDHRVAATRTARAAAAARAATPARTGAGGAARGRSGAAAPALTAGRGGRGRGTAGPVAADARAAAGVATAAAAGLAAVAVGIIVGIAEAGGIQEAGLAGEADQGSKGHVKRRFFHTLCVLPFRHALRKERLIGTTSTCRRAVTRIL